MFRVEGLQRAARNSCGEDDLEKSCPIISNCCQINIISRMTTMIVQVLAIKVLLSNLLGAAFVPGFVYSKLRRAGVSEQADPGKETAPLYFSLPECKSGNHLRLDGNLPHADCSNVLHCHDKNAMCRRSKHITVLWQDFVRENLFARAKNKRGVQDSHVENTLAQVPLNNKRNSITQPPSMLQAIPAPPRST